MIQKSVRIIQQHPTDDSSSVLVHMCVSTPGGRECRTVQYDLEKQIFIDPPHSAFAGDTEALKAFINRYLASIRMGRKDFWGST